jgi:hypothetical protein
VISSANGGTILPARSVSSLITVCAASTPARRKPWLSSIPRKITPPPGLVRKGRERFKETLGETSLCAFDFQTSVFVLLAAHGFDQFKSFLCVHLTNNYTNGSFMEAFNFKESARQGLAKFSLPRFFGYCRVRLGFWGIHRLSGSYSPWSGHPPSPLSV